MPELEKDTTQFIDLIRKSRRGKFKIDIGMSAGVGKTYMFNEMLNKLSEANIDIVILS